MPARTMPARRPCVEPARHDLWRYAALYHPVLPASHWLTLGEGWTPAVELPGLAAAVGLDRLVAKREDLNPTGSHKARGLAFQIAALRWQRPDVAWLTISSSGNAALAAAAYARAAGLRLAAFVAPRTPVEVRRAIARVGALVLVSPRALGLASSLAAAHDIPNLRPSTDPSAVEGFQSIGWELAETIAPVDAVFTFASSGTSLVGIGRAFERAEVVTDDAWRPALHVVQGTGGHAIAAAFDPERGAVAPGRLGARAARTTRRLGEARRLVRASGGTGWVITDAEAEAARTLLESHAIRTSLEGGAALAAAARAAAAGGVASAVVVLTGRRRDASSEPGGPAAPGGAEHFVDDLAAVERVLWP